MSIFLVCIGCRRRRGELKKFNSEEWKASSQVERGYMTSDLIKRKLLVGKTKPEVLEMLGVPKDISRTRFHYLLDYGYSTPFHLDVIFAKTNQRITEAKVSD